MSRVYSTRTKCPGCMSWTMEMTIELDGSHDGILHCIECGATKPVKDTDDRFYGRGGSKA